MTGTEIDGMTAEEHRAKANEALDKREESWERSDTDGFLSQWAHGITAQEHQAKAEIAENGGKSQFMVIVNAETGEVVPSKVIDTRYGSKRVTFEGDTDRYAEFFSPYSERAFAKRGYAEAWVEHAAVAFITGRGRGLSGTAWVARAPVCEKCSKFVVIGRACPDCGHVTEATFIENPYVEVEAAEAEES